MTVHRPEDADHESSMQVTISADGFITSQQDALRALFARADFGLCIADGRIRASGRAAQRLERAVAQCRRDSTPVTIAFPERKECGALILDICAVGAIAGGQEAVGAAGFVGTFRHVATNNLPSRDRIGLALGLSPAEAALSLALARGVSPDDYSRRQGITKNTVRSQLAVVRKKTGAHSQTQIANLIWLLANARV